MRASNRRSLLACIAIALAAATAEAQTLETYCSVDAANEAPTSDVLHPALVYASFSAEIDRNEWGRIARTLEEDFRRSASAIPADMRMKFQAQLTVFADEMEAVENSPNAAEAVAKAQGVRQVRFTINTNVNEGGFYVFGGMPDRIDFPPGTPLPIARDICYRAHAAQKLLVRYGQAGRERAANALGYYVSLWDNYNRRGYSQYPWELYLNGLWTINPATFLPPASQWVLGHPAVAIEMTWPRSSDLRRLDIVTFEPIGYIHYNRARTSYGGASFLVTLSATANPGYGVLAHVGRLGKVGYVYHPHDVANAHHGAVFSIDLYKIIGGVPQKLQDAKARVEGIRNSFAR
jgi:hypothetical protein